MLVLNNKVLKYLHTYFTFGYIFPATARGNSADCNCRAFVFQTQMAATR